MSRGIIIELRPKDGADFSEFVDDYKNGRPVDLTPYEVFVHGSIIDSFRPEFLEYITKYGLSSLLGRKLVVEALVPSPHPRNLVEELVKGFVQQIATSDELIIVDGYFFATISDVRYPDFIENILDPVLSTLTTLKIITLPNKVDPNLKQTIEARLSAKNSRLSISHATSSSFHDRFWINRQAMKGFLMGTSLNGLGKRYALLDYLQESDVKDIVKALVAESLV